MWLIVVALNNKSSPMEDTEAQDATVSPYEGGQQPDSSRALMWGQQVQRHKWVMGLAWRVMGLAWWEMGLAWHKKRGNC